MGPSIGKSTKHLHILMLIRRSVLGSVACMPPLPRDIILVQQGSEVKY
jgi:hypothetical protein